MTCTGARKTLLVCTSHDATDMDLRWVHHYANEHAGNQGYSFLSNFHEDSKLQGRARDIMSLLSDLTNNSKFELNYVQDIIIYDSQIHNGTHLKLHQKGMYNVGRCECYI